MGVNLFGDMQALPTAGAGDVEDDGRADYDLDPWERREREEHARARAEMLAKEAAAGAELPVLSPAEIPAGPAPERTAVLIQARDVWDESAPDCMPLDQASMCRLDPMTVMTDADAFQYKSGGTAKGVIGTLTDVKRWDNDLAGVMYVWQRRDGQLFVVDGHQRLELAQRMVAAGQPDVRLVAKVWREEDGFDQQDMRMRAAKKNISEGSGTAVDAARVLRQDPTILDTISAKSPVAKKARGIAALDGEAFEYATGQINRGNLSEYAASLVGEWASAKGFDGRDLGRGTDAQMGALRDMVRETTREGGGLTESESRELMEDISQNQLTKEVQTRQQGFASMKVEALDSAFRERARIKKAAKQKFAESRRLYRTVVKGDSKLEELGNELDYDANKTAADRAADAELLFSGPTATGPLAAWLRLKAKEMKHMDYPPGEQKLFISKSVNALDPYLDDWEGQGQEKLWQYVREEEPRVDARIDEWNQRVKDFQEGRDAGYPEFQKVEMKEYFKKEKQREKWRRADEKKREKKRAAKEAGRLIKSESAASVIADAASVSSETDSLVVADVGGEDVLVADVTPAEKKRERRKRVGTETPPEVEQAIETALEVVGETGADQVTVVGDLPSGDEFRVTVHADDAGAADCPVPAPKKPRSPRKPKAGAAVAPEPAPEVVEPEKPKRGGRKAKVAPEPEVVSPMGGGGLFTPVDDGAKSAADIEKPKRGGRKAKEAAAVVDSDEFPASRAETRPEPRIPESRVRAETKSAAKAPSGRGGRRGIDYIAGLEQWQSEQRAAKTKAKPLPKAAPVKSGGRGRGGSQGLLSLPQPKGVRRVAKK